MVRANTEQPQVPPALPCDGRPAQQGSDSLLTGWWPCWWHCGPSERLASCHKQPELTRLWSWVRTESRRQEHKPPHVTAGSSGDSGGSGLHLILPQVLRLPEWTSWEQVVDLGHIPRPGGPVLTLTRVISELGPQWHFPKALLLLLQLQLLDKWPAKGPDFPGIHWTPGGLAGWQELMVCISSHLHIQSHHVGCLKSILVGVFTPWKLANAARRALPSPHTAGCATPTQSSRARAGLPVLSRVRTCYCIRPGCCPRAQGSALLS